MRTPKTAKKSPSLKRANRATPRPRQTESSESSSARVSTPPARPCRSASATAPAMLAATYSATVRSVFVMRPPPPCVAGEEPPGARILHAERQAAPPPRCDE